MIKEAQTLIPKTPTSELEKIRSTFDENKYIKILNIELSSELNNAPILFKPFALVLKSSVDQYLDFRKQIDLQIAQDLEIFLVGLEADLPMGILIE